MQLSESARKAMEIKQQTPSVIARLMGLDDLPHQKPIHKHHRVLSDDYLRKSASIGLLEKQLSYSKRSFGMSRTKVPELKDMFEGPEQQKQCIQTMFKDKKASWATKGSVRFENRNSTDSNCLKLDEKISDSVKFGETVKIIHCDKEILPKHFQKRDSLFLGHAHDLLHIHYPLGQRTVFKLSSGPYFINNKKGGKLEKRTARRKVLRSPKKLQYDSDTSNIEVVTTSYSSFLDPKNQQFASYPSSNWSICTRVAKNIDPEQQEMPKRVQIGTTTQCPTTCEMLYSSDQKRYQKTCKFDKHDWSSKYSQETLGLSRRLGVNNMNNMRNNIIVNSSRFRKFPASHNAVRNAKSSNGNDALHNYECLRREEAITEAGNILRNQFFCEKDKSNHEHSGLRCEVSQSPAMDVEHNHSTGKTILGKEPKAKQPELTNSKLMGSDGIFSPEASHICVGQELPIGCPEDGLIFSSCFEIEPELAASWRNTHQASPNSVLDHPYEEENISDIECFVSAGANLNGLWKQLQLLKSDGEDTFSEGLRMMVSSDEDTTDEFVDFTEGNGNTVRVFRAEETRDFSYLVDVLDEAGLYDANWEISFDRWRSPECAVNPSVFEVIEKKYGDQTSWKKPERALLFDRINSGLVEIMQHIMDIPNWANPWSTLLRTQVKRDVVEEKLWNLLVSQEKDVDKGLSEKAVGSDVWWLKLGDDIDSIVGEIDKVLFDELVAELGSV